MNLIDYCLNNIFAVVVLMYANMKFGVVKMCVRNNLYICRKECKESVLCGKWQETVLLDLQE